MPENEQKESNLIKSLLKTILLIWKLKQIPPPSIYKFKKNKTMKTKFQPIVIITLAIFIFSSCSKKKDQSNITKQAIMKMEVSYAGDLQSQVAVLTFLVVNSENSLVNIVNENTENASAGPFIQNEDFDSKMISFHSVDKVSSASIMLSLSPKVYETTPENNLSITIKIYFDGKLADNQTFSYDQVSDGTSSKPKDFDYKVTAK